MSRAGEEDEKNEYEVSTINNKQTNAQWMKRESEREGEIDAYKKVEQNECDTQSTEH